MRNQLKVDWARKVKKSDLGPALGRYRRFLVDLGFRDSTIDMYVFRARKYLEFAETEQPSAEDFIRFREVLQDKRLSRSTLNQYGFSIRKYHEMIKQPITFPFLKPNDTIPYFFNEQDVAKILSVIHNLKHYCMLIVMFYGCLRASELCSLNDGDVDFEAKTIRIREGKGGHEAIVPLNPEVTPILRDYLKVRPSLKVNGEQPLFITDYCRRWDRMDVHRMFRQYKKKANIDKPGGLHVFGRHSPASIMIKNGCDIMTIKAIMRHRDIETTARYLHISDQTKREKYEKYLTL
jgi:integrase/recombinase XerD